MRLDTQVLGRANMTQTQLLMWTGQMLSRKLPIYNMGMAIQIEAVLDYPRFRDSFDFVVEKSDNMRSVFQYIDGAPRRVVIEPGEMDYEFPLVDFSDNPQYVEAWMQERLARRIVMTRRLFRSALLQTGPASFTWFICKHHLICDGWSFANFVAAVGERYRRLGTGDDSDYDLPAFDEFVRREVQYYLGDECARSSAYWDEVTREPLPPLRMYGKGADEGSSRFQRFHRHLDGEFVGRMRAAVADGEFSAFSPDQGLYLLLITALVVQLKRASGNKRFAIGVCLHHRLSSVDKKTIGPYFVFSALRVRLEHGDSFRDLFLRVALEYRRMLRHYRHPVSAPPDDRTWDVTINFVNKTFPPFAGIPTTVTWLQSGSYLAQEFVGIQIQQFNAGPGLTAEWDFNLGIFDTEERRQRAMSDFEQAMDFGLRNPDAPLRDFI
ncbi:MAG: hypothetical protein KJO31_16835 [Gammaproteobacteria bacterium]|nr:hypothetical protein [Gammaproteobacteria bacterium]